MTTIPANSDVWVIHDDHALLYRQQEKIWALESRMPFTDFHGSAVALASFTLAETVVYLNIKKDDRRGDLLDQFRWLGVEQDPLRISEFSYAAEQMQLMHTLKTMGKYASVIAINDPAQFLHAPKLFLADQQQTTHLKTWVKTRKNGASKHWATARLCCALWVKPGRQHQKLRFVALVCTAITIAAMKWAQDRQVKHDDTQWQKSIRTALEDQSARTNVISFEEWSKQIKKFGQNNRANVSGLNIHWSKSGNVHTFVQLERDRKKVPKGCQLVSSKKVECISPRDE
jgi:hypothetical protein